VAAACALEAAFEDEDAVDGANEADLEGVFEAERLLSDAMECVSSSTVIYQFKFSTITMNTF
jgi:hypothetical protein